MQRGTRTGLALACVLGAVGVLVAVFSEHWYHAISRYAHDLAEADRVDWFGIDGPWVDRAQETLLHKVAAVGSGLSAIPALGCALVVALGTLAGARRNYVPRLPAAIAWVLGSAMVVLQGLSVATWQTDRLVEPRGYGWATPLFFASGMVMAGSCLALWIDARRRARASATALATIEREQQRAELAALPGGDAAPGTEPEDHTVEL